MWNILIVIIIAAIIWAFNPLLHNEIKPTAGVDKKTQTQVNQIENQAINQVNQARQIQKQQENAINNQ